MYLLKPKYNVGFMGTTRINPNVCVNVSSWIGTNVPHSLIMGESVGRPVGTREFLHLLLNFSLNLKLLLKNEYLKRKKN